MVPDFGVHTINKGYELRIDEHRPEIRKQDEGGKAQHQKRSDSTPVLGAPFDPRGPPLGSPTAPASAAAVCSVLERRLRSALDAGLLGSGGGGGEGSRDTKLSD